jgi:hypothetical protein
LVCKPITSAFGIGDGLFGVIGLAILPLDVLTARRPSAAKTVIYQLAGWQ